MADSVGAGPGPRVVLLEPRRGANVGAACRAIKNMGAGPLVVVAGGFDRDEARRTAVHAADVFDARLEAATFEEAVATASVVVGTTSRLTAWRVPVRPVDEVFAGLRAAGVEGRDVALVFGREDRGLDNEELSRCHRLATIPTAGDYDSLNLGQAVVVCLYEWLQSGRGRAAAAAASTPMAAAVTAAEAGAMLADLREVLVEIGFLHGDQSERVMAAVASLLTRGGLDERDVRILRGMVRQVRWAARRGAGEGAAGVVARKVEGK